MLKSGVRTSCEYTVINCINEEQSLTINAFQSLALVRDTNNSLRVR